MLLAIIDWYSDKATSTAMSETLELFDDTSGKMALQATLEFLRLAPSHSPVEKINTNDVSARDNNAVVQTVSDVLFGALGWFRSAERAFAWQLQCIAFPADTEVIN
jgi:hypothetical protein